MHWIEDYRYESQDWPEENERPESLLSFCANPYVLIGHEQEYPGACRWPIYHIQCPHCKEWTGDYGDVSEDTERGMEYLCGPCGNRVIQMEEQSVQSQD